MSFAVELDKKKVVYKLKSNYDSLIPKIPCFDATLETKLVPKDIYGLKKECSVRYEDKNSDEGFYTQANALIKSGHEIVLNLNDRLDVKSRKPVNETFKLNSIKDLDNFYEKVLKPQKSKH